MGEEGEVGGGGRGKWIDVGEGCGRDDWVDLPLVEGHCRGWPGRNSRGWHWSPLVYGHGGHLYQQCVSLEHLWREQEKVSERQTETKGKGGREGEEYHRETAIDNTLKWKFSELCGD